MPPCRVSVNPPKDCRTYELVFELANVIEFTSQFASMSGTYTCGLAKLPPNTRFAVPLFVGVALGLQLSLRVHLTFPAQAPLTLSWAFTGQLTRTEADAHAPQTTTFTR